MLLPLGGGEPSSRGSRACLMEYRMGETPVAPLHLHTPPRDPPTTQPERDISIPTKASKLDLMCQAYLSAGLTLEAS